ncbi:MAG: hypothetical protein R3C25_05075 [Hyphomonadaceae bacterium]
MATTGWRTPSTTAPWIPFTAARRIGPTRPSPQAGRGRSLPGTPPPIPGDSAAARAAIQRAHERIGEGDMDGARAVAGAAVDGPRSGQAQWQLGLIAYYTHDYAEAVRQFEASAQWPHHGGWAMAAAHYWAARARLAAGETQGVTQHLKRGRATSMDFLRAASGDAAGPRQRAGI